MIDPELIRGFDGDVIRFVVDPDGVFEIHEADGSITTGVAVRGRPLLSGDDE